MVSSVIFRLFLAVMLLLFPAGGALAAESPGLHNISVGMHPGGLLCIVIFVVSYAAVLLEEYTHLRKSKPVLLGASLIWVVIAIIAPDYGVDHHALRNAVFHGLGEYASLLLFLLAAMTYISAMDDRKVFEVLKDKLVQAGLSLRQLFWVTGILAFFLSPLADNLTTALVLGTVIMTVGRNDPKFVALACVNVVNAANAGGAFSPFGDITTLMVWQAGRVDFFEFFALFLPSVACFLVPAILLTPWVSSDKPEALVKNTRLKRGAKVIIFLGLLTIAMAVSFEQLLGLPPFVGMMAGLSLLMTAAWFIRHFGSSRDQKFDILDNVAAAEWDTLLFFFGVIFSVGGLTFLGYLEIASAVLYEGWGASATNVVLGFASALFDNIPIMFGVLSMQPEMNLFQWLLITLTAGVGGSMLSIGSAAGVALMGVARGHYTFFGHLKWFPFLFLGYAAAVATHFWVNGDMIDLP